MVIDAHPHLWNTQRLYYEWLQRPELGGGYVKMWTELSKLFDQLSPPERAAVLAGTATRFYSLGTPAEGTGRDGR